MSQSTTHYQLFIGEASDNYNPLTQTNGNMNKIDNAMFENKMASFVTAVESKAGVNHNLSIQSDDEDVPFIHFTATARFSENDTFTVNSTNVTALTPAGTPLPDGAYIIGSDVICYLRDTQLTVFVSDAGEIDLSEYAKLTDLTPIETKADTATTLAQAAGTTAQAANTLATQTAQTVSGMFDGITQIAYVQSLPSNPDATTLYLIPET